ncbi:MAG: sulfotransferase family protein [Actinomycetes bacterium]
MAEHENGTDRVAGALPNLVLAGVTKAGTTSLFNYLGQHPEIGVAGVKEINYFTPLLYGDSLAPLSEYSRHFARCADRPWRLDASPAYFVGGAELATAVQATLPDARVLIALRDPVRRFWSSYTYKHSKGRLPKDMTFPAFIAKCRQLRDAGVDGTPENVVYRTLSAGMYADYLEGWFDVFGDALRVVFFETLADDPRMVLSDICRWLGIDAAPVASMDLAARNATTQPRSLRLRRAAHRLNAALAPVVGDSVRRRLKRSYDRVNSGSLDERLGDAEREELAEFYAEANARCAALLTARGYADLPDWLSPTPATPRPAGQSS